MPKRRFFMDSEFIDDGKTIELISIGIVCEDGRELYLVNNECDLSRANDWVKENVIPQLPPRSTQFNDPIWTHRRNIQRAVADFLGCTLPDDGSWQYILAEGEPKPEVWTYYGAYDWVVFCQLFGDMMRLPKGFPMYSMDIKQLCVQLGDPELPRQEKGLHSAIEDARHNKLMWEFLDHRQQSRPYI